MIELLVNSLAAAALISTPLLLAAMGGLVNQRGGIVNIGLEGLMLVGAFVAVLTSWQTGNVVLAVAAAAVAGALVATPFSLAITRFGANEIIAGFGLNIVIAGVLGYALPVVFGTYGTLAPADLARLPRLELPLLDEVPLLDRIVSGKDPLTYLAWASVPAVAWFLDRTVWGIRLRAAGSDLDAARAAGIDVLAWRDGSTIIAGVFSALAGAQIAIGQVALFNVGMIAGRGFIALAAFYFGRARPWPTAGAALLFGFFDAAQVRLQGQGVPPQLVQMLPYLVVVLALTALALSRGRTESSEVTP